MFGWEFPPRFSGGLGVACEGLVGGLLARGTRITLVLPHAAPPRSGPALTILDANDLLGGPRAQDAPGLEVWRVASPLHPYLDAPAYAAGTGQTYATESGQSDGEGGPRLLQGGYGRNLRQEVLRYAEAAARLVSGEPFDVIHAHDWMTFPAGRLMQRLSGRPLVVHVHATEYDRAGGEGDPWISSVEREGLRGADRVICVSNYTARISRERYRVAEEKLRVVHNAIDAEPGPVKLEFSEEEPVVLFAGRLTLQKGPDYFVEAARLVLTERPDVRFVLAGEGDMKPRLLERVAGWGLGDRILFTGFLDPPVVRRLFERADVYVLPSVSEPFGLTVLEALRQGTPVILSRGAGVSEVVRHALRVDFWDTRELAGKILSVLRFEPLRRELARRGNAEVCGLTWEQAASRCLAVYEEAMAERAAPAGELAS